MGDRLAELDTLVEAHLGLSEARLGLVEPLLGLMSLAVPLVGAAEPNPSDPTALSCPAEPAKVFIARL